MDINIRCPNCSKIITLTLQDNPVYDYSCNHCGDTGKMVLDSDRYQLLFDFGIICIKKGFLKEAVSNLASAEERCFEYAVKYILHNNKTSDDTIKKLWKEVASQSERQYGAFYFLFFYTFGKQIERVDPAFRNRVIHNGVFPNERETKEYARSIYINITSIIDSLFHLPTDLYTDVNFGDLYRYAHSPFITRIPEKRYDFETLYQNFYANDEFELPYG